MTQPGEMGEVVAPGFAPHDTDDTERSDEGEGVDRRVKKSGAETFTTAGDQAEQRITGVRDSRVGEQPAHI